MTRSQEVANREADSSSMDATKRFIAGLEISEIYFREASFRFSPELKTQNEPIRLSMNVVAKSVPLGPNAFEAIQVLTLKGRTRPKARLLVNMKCELVAIYKTAVEMTPELFDLFKGSSLILNTWPFLREFVQSCTVRAGLPPLILPLVKPASQSRSES